MIRFMLATLCAMLLFHIGVQSQDSRIVDSLRTVLEDSEGKERYSALRRLAVEFIDYNNEKALSIVRKAEQVAVSSDDSAAIVDSNRLKGQILSRLGRIDAVILNL